MNYLKLILLIFFTFLISCNKKQDLKVEKKQNDSVIIYNEESFYNSKSKKIKVIDTMCAFQEKRAIDDFKNGKQTYILLYGIGTYDYSNIEMSELLLKYSIKLDSIFLSCSSPPKGFQRNCYAKNMNLQIEKKFGAKFIDSLRNIADKQFVKNNPKYIFQFTECDMESRYESAKTYKEFIEKPENDFVKTIKYEKLNKIETKKQKANTDIYFTIYKNGTIGNLKVETDFTISKNKDFMNYFEKEALNFVKKAKWKPAKYRGINVNSEMFLNFYNK